MKRFASSAVALVLSAGLVLAGFGFGTGGLGDGATTNGGAPGCCRQIA
ncbi:hypothetical protein [uncultured Cellulomonas sp.]|nr:hypothetical protein [uncultured Cellulomonas sp.]